jgi:D-alanyl-lipoteichoic acid acyltransferase DltB (MBOAT superfamily)
MLFNSLEFLVFLAVVYALYRALAFRWQNWMLLVASYLFYGWWDWRFLFLMILSTSVDFWTGLVLERGRLRLAERLVPAAFLTAAAVFLIGFDASEIFHRIGGGGARRAVISDLMPYVLIGMPVFIGAALVSYRMLVSLEEERRRKACMILSIVVQLSVLGFFKYFNFFVDSMHDALAGAGFQPERFHLEIVLPVGISFYTFQSMSYAIDIYRRELKPTDKFFDFALFVAFFPQLVAGPIERARNLLPQMTQPRTITGDQTRRGLFLIAFGLFKKIAIADGMAITADSAFAIANPTWGTVIVGTLAFAVQIYCDFSGYSDIARGVSKLFGVELMYNFNQPYFARSPREFWQRWHISLSTWLSDYLYKPLGGNRGSLAFTCRNLMLTMILGGLWHGAAWNYVLWGFYHGILLSTHRVLVSKFGAASDGRALAVLKMAGFGMLTLYGWLLFRARSLEQVAVHTTTLFTGRGGLAIEAARPALSAVLGIILLVVWEIAQYRRGGDARFYRAVPTPVTGLAVALMLFLILMGTSNEPAQFIYFQF